MTPPSWRGTKKPLDKSESGEWKSWLKAQHSENEDHGIWSHHFMGNRWGNSKQCQTIFLGSKITSYGECCNEIKRCLLLGRKVMTNLDSIFKSRDITLPTKVRLVKKRLWCWEGLGAGGEGDARGWDGWMASLTRWMWVWVNSGSWWWTGILACCDSWGCKELDTTKQLNWTDV